MSRDLIAACRRGDRDAFEEVVRRTHRHVYTQALRMVRDPQEAEDVAQEAYLRVFRGLPAFRGEARFETWLYRIVANAAINLLHRRGRFGDLLSDPAEDPFGAVPADERLAEDAVDRDLLRRALDSLPESLRVVVLLKDVYGLPCLEIGEEIGVSEGAVKVRLHRARKRLRDELFVPPDDERRHPSLPGFDPGTGRRPGPPGRTGRPGRRRREV